MNNDQFKSVTRALRYKNDTNGNCTLQRVPAGWDDSTPAEEHTRRIVVSNGNAYWRSQGNDPRNPRFNDKPTRWAGESNPKYAQCYLPTGYYEWVKENKED